MANKAPNGKCSSQLQKGKVQNSQDKLSKKLQLDLERDLLRLFQDSLYCDIKLSVESSFILTHSCILRTRAYKFYKYIYAEFDVFVQDGISVFNIYNASFTHLQVFVKNIYTDLHTAKAEDCIIQHLQEAKGCYSLKPETSENRSVKKANTPDADLFFTPKCSPSELQKPFSPSKLNLQESNVASYYKIVSVDDIPGDEKCEDKKLSEQILEKELEEQDKLLSSFKTIFSKNTKTKPNSFSLGTTSQSAKKAKPKFNRKFDTRVLLYDDRDKSKIKLPLWKPNPVSELHNLKRDKLKINKESLNLQGKIEFERNFEDANNSLCGSDMDVSTTGGDSGLDNSLICQQEASPKEITVSETSGVDLTEAAINEEMPNDETISTKRSTESSGSSEAGTWDANDDFKAKSSLTVSDCELKSNLNEEELIRLDEMERNIRDCEIFLYMERQGSHCGECYHKKHSTTDEDADPYMSNKNVAYLYAKEGVNEMNNPSNLLQGETDCRLNNDEENDYIYNLRQERNVDDAIMSCENLNDVNRVNENYEELDANESLIQGASDDIILNSNSNYFVDQNTEEIKTPPCTPKKVKSERSGDESRETEEFSTTKTKSWENNNTTGVNNYFIDASSLLDEDEIISPPISLINFKSLQSCEEPERESEMEQEVEEPEESEERLDEELNREPDRIALYPKEESTTLSKKVVTNFFTPDSSDDTVSSYLREQERKQGDIIFKNSIPHFSKHEVDENQILENKERLRGGADRFNPESVEDDSEQVVPSANVDEFSPTYGSMNQVPSDSRFSVKSNFFESEPSLEYTSEPVEKFQGHLDDDAVESQTILSRHSSIKDVSSSSACSGSPNLGRRNETVPILSGGMDFVEEKIHRKPSQSQGEAWVVTFDDNRKHRNRITSSDTASDAESIRENGGNRKMSSSNVSFNEESQNKRREPSVEFYIRDQIDGKLEKESKPEPKANPVEKSSSFGYFLDFKEDAENRTEKSSQPEEKKNNMFSMFIGMNENSKPTFSRKPKPELEKVNTSIKETKESPSKPAECSEDVKKSFYMFIESDSPNVKRKQISKKPPDSSVRKPYLRTQSYTVERPAEDQSKPEVKTDYECSSSDNSIPYVENISRSNRVMKGRLPLNKVRTPTQEEHKITAWSETKVPNDSNFPSESWLRTKDIQVNYTGKNDHRDDFGLKKDSTFVKENEHKKEKLFDRVRTSRHLGDGKPPKRDSGVVLSDKNEDSFVKLSDLDSSDHLRTKQQRDRMSQSITESSTKKNSAREEALSRSIGSEGGKGRISDLYDKQVNKSLSRLFPNLSAQSLASISRRDGNKAEVEKSDIYMSETSEVSSSMQSSFGPVGLEISTSETDVSSHVEPNTRLGEDLLKMFLEEISPDVVVEVGGRRIKAHKCILSSRCQYFAAMLSGGWVESAGNVISIQRFSYNAVHFALRHIYSGESRIPESLNIDELATLADMLCLDGLQEIISHNLKVKYCHSFHVPCSVCSEGVMDCLYIVAANGLDDLYQKCLRWITKYFVKLWPTKGFGSLPEVLLEKCYQHYIVHMTVDNVLDTVVNIDKVRGSLPNVRWAESVSRLVNRLHHATLKYIADHFSSVLTSDNFLALGKESRWNVSLIEDSLIESIKYLPPEQACWSHARLHRILSVASAPEPPPEMEWTESFLKLLHLIDELVENSLIKQAPRAAKSKAWRQMEPELRSRIQEAACLVLPDNEPSPTYRHSNHAKRESHQPSIPQTAKSRNFEIRQIKLAMSQQGNRNPTNSRPLSLQIDHRPKKDSRFVPLRPSVSTSSVRKPEPTEGIRKTQSRSQILGSINSEPKKTINPKYSEVKSRYLEPRSPQKNVANKPAASANQRRTFRYISSSDSSRNCSPALRPSNSRTSIPQAKKSVVGSNRQSYKSESSTHDNKRDRSFASTKPDTPSAAKLSRLAGDENMSTDSLCTDSLISEKEATFRRRPGKENVGEKRKAGNVLPLTKSTGNSPIALRHNSESWSSASSKSIAKKKLIIPKVSNESKSIPPKRFSSAKTTAGNQNKLNVSSPRTTVNRNQRNSGKTDSNLVNGNSLNRKRSEVDSENNKNSLDTTEEPSAVERSGTFLKDEPTILKKPQVESEA